MTKQQLAAALAALSSGAATAQVDTTALQTSVLADIATVTAFGFAVLAAYLAASIGIKLVKKFANKAT